MKTRNPEWWGVHTRYVIEGREFDTAHSAYAFANEVKGVECDECTFYSRLTRGHLTWAKLCGPADVVLASARKRTAEKKRAEMAAVIAALDARKAGLA